MQIFKKIINIIINILIVLLLAVSVLVAALALASKSGGVPSVLGYVPLSVQSDSMIPEFEKGDLIISKAVDDSTALEKGDVITFKTEIMGEEALNTHRIVDVTQTEGMEFYTTKGDNNNIEDAEPVARVSVAAKWEGIKFDGLGDAYDFLTSQFGFFLVILLPLIIFFIYEIIRFVKNLIEYNKEKALEQAMENSAVAAASGLSEDEMKAAVEQYLAQQSQENTDSADSENAEE
ncbi:MULTISPECIES: signal peptidase I [unclassified Ruminococcus]|uniref:signal peptidase I n=1 Tax=unclassified Ruminococcus TaxID=2608920 RepID=UPI002109C0C3|nr:MULTISPECIES: signal peptidase I [unclassified Ruminococcus]MCQ4021512.1 signal peptidase I [Ruminococcus sp. zg-924]MCQ4113957.1 signal peptidase I [Ruminococcus sp. zg-921]